MTDLQILKQLTKEYQILGIEQKYKLDENNRVIEIYITGLNITHLDLFSSLESLEILFLSGNKIKNITPLKKLKKLKKLGLDEIATSDFSSLQELKNLEYLCLNKNKITDISFIKNLKKLKRLELKDNDVSHILSLKNLISLEHLDLRSNQISEISILTNLKKLKNIYLNNNQIQNFSPLKNLKHTTIYLEEKESYLKEVEIKNFFSIKNLKIKDLTDKKEIYFLGENGEGKTILLQSIIISLVRPFYYTKLIHILNTKSKCTLQSKDSNFIHYQFNYDLKKLNNNRLKNIFAYGVGRLRTSENINVIDKTGYMSLFDNNTVLQHPVFWLKEIDRLNWRNETNLKTETLINLFENLLENKVKIKIGREVLFIEKDTELQFDQLADGYKSVLIWLADLLSRLTENQPEVTELKNYHGIVLVDEIDILLHPRWQYIIVKKLRSLFPEIQWIFTTHSPIITLGASKDAVFYKVYKEKGATKVSNPYHSETFSNQSLNALVTSPLFDLTSARPASYQDSELNLKTEEFYYAIIHEQVKKHFENKPPKNIDEVKNVIDDILGELENEGKL